jgi:hypothetical protein
MMLGAAVFACAWYNNFWRQDLSRALQRSDTGVSAKTDAASAAAAPEGDDRASEAADVGTRTWGSSGTASLGLGSTLGAASMGADSGGSRSQGLSDWLERRRLRSRSIHFEGFEGFDSDESDGGDWKPLQSMGLASLGGFARSDSQKSDRRGCDDLYKYIEETNASWTLFFRIMGALAQVWGMLGLMYWSLLTKDDELMDCLAHRSYGQFVTHLCTYTHACLRGFPILAANVTLVLMIRIQIQNRIYYSMLSRGYILDFADTEILSTHWPWVFALSMVQGGAHLLLKMYYDPNPISVDSYVNLLRKFVLPGMIFLSFFMRYAEIENTLVPLNKLVERDYSKNDRTLPTLSEMQAMNERILAFYCRKCDVIGDCCDAINKDPDLDDLIQFLIDNYEKASEKFYNTKRHYSWGFFRSLWPAAVLVDRRLDWNEPKTRSWLYTVGILLCGCSVVLFCSMCFFIASIWRNVLLSQAYMPAKIIEIDVVTETGLAITVLAVHALMVILFLHRTIKGMFYFDIRAREVDVSQLEAKAKA